MSAITQVADAVATRLNNQSFTPPITAQRMHLPIFDLGKVGDAIQVSVVPRSLTVTDSTRTQNFYDIAVDIGVQQRVDPNNTSQIDALLDLVEHIGDSLRLQRLETMPEAQWIGLENDPVVAVEHLEQHNVFTSVLTVTYRIMR